jgi:hypothetical protein
MQRMSSALIAAVAAVIPVVSFAATGAVLEESVKTWAEVEQENTAEESIDMQQMEDESSDELFPAGTSSSSQGTISEQRSSRTSAYISVTVDGRLITFGDVPRDEWFAPYVRDIAERGIVSGYRDADGNPLGLFGPADNVTVGQLAKIALASSSSLDDCPTTPPLNLTASGTWAASYIACTEKLGWTLFADGSIDVNRPATRAEVVVTLLGAFKAPIGEPTGTAFTDVTASTLYNPAIEQAKKDGIISGYTDEDGNLTGLFGPDDSVTRAELSKIVTLTLQIYGQK